MIIVSTRHPRFVIHFVPTSCSWLNLIERWSRELTTKRIRRDSFPSVPDLVAAIAEFLETWNENLKPFVRRATVESLLAKLSGCRFHRRARTQRAAPSLPHLGCAGTRAGSTRSSAGSRSSPSGLFGAGRSAVCASWCATSTTTCAITIATTARLPGPPPPIPSSMNSSAFVNLLTGHNTRLAYDEKRHIAFGAGTCLHRDYFPVASAVEAMTGSNIRHHKKRLSCSEKVVSGRSGAQGCGASQH